MPAFQKRHTIYISAVHDQRVGHLLIEAFAPLDDQNSLKKG